MEIWKDIKGYEGLYQVSNLGRVKSLSKRLHFINHNTGKSCYRITKEFFISIGKCRGYNSVHLHKDNVSKTRRLCRLVAEAFIPNPENKPCVNHIDGIKSNDNVNNLEWVTYSENMEHAIKTGLHKVKRGSDRHNSKKVKCDLTGIVFDTIKDAARYKGIDESTLSRSIRGVYKKSHNISFID